MSTKLMSRAPREAALKILTHMEADPYTPPASEIGPEKIDQRRQGRWIARLGVALYTGPAWGLAGTAVGMIRAFNTLAEDEAASADALSHDISIALMTTMIGISAALVGAVLILIALLAAKNRERWFFMWSVLLSASWCIVLFPYGLIAGLPILILFVVKRAEFLGSNKALH